MRSIAITGLKNRNTCSSSRNRVSLHCHQNKDLLGENIKSSFVRNSHTHNSRQSYVFIAKLKPTSIFSDWIPKQADVQVGVTCSREKVMTTPGRDGRSWKSEKKQNILLTISDVTRAPENDCPRFEGSF